MFSVTDTLVQFTLVIHTKPFSSRLVISKEIQNQAILSQDLFLIVKEAVYMLDIADALFYLKMMS